MTQGQEPNLARDVRALITEVRALSDQLKKFPEREEVRRNYVARQEARKRVVYFVAFILISFVISYGMAITTVSVCFLSANVSQNTCSYIPGYEDSMKRNQKLIEQFERLNRITSRNTNRLDKLQ